MRRCRLAWVSLPSFPSLSERLGVVFRLFELEFDPEATALARGAVVEFRFPELEAELLLLPEFDFLSEPLSGLLEVAVSRDISPCHSQ
jgi:hypothetical protein